MTDEAPAEGKTTRLVILPTREDLHKAISLAEKTLSEEEGKHQGVSWTFSADKLLADSPSKVAEGDTAFNLYHYQLIFFMDAQEWNASPPFLWMSGQTPVIPMALPQEQRPTNSDQGPRRASCLLTFLRCSFGIVAAL